MLEQFILGAVQGIAEWLPVSSEGLIFLIKANFFNNGLEVKEIIADILFLHLGTFLAALIYFWKDVKHLLKALFRYRRSDVATQKTLGFLVWATIISGGLGFFLLEMVDRLGTGLENASRVFTLVVGLLLLITAWLQIRARNGGVRTSGDIKTGDGLLLGLVQGLAALPGLSRSGLTVSALLLDNFNKETALRLSFILSLPITLGANIILNADKFALNWESLAGLLGAFIFGILTIKLLLGLARRINFGYFVLFFAIFTLGALLL